jgi:hypothetical protein
MDSRLPRFARRQSRLCRAGAAAARRSARPLDDARGGRAFGRLAAVATRHDPLTGASAFPDLSELPVAVLDVPRQAPPRATAHVSFSPLPRIRLAEPYERLRDASDWARAATRQRPRVFLANLGTSADFTARDLRQEFLRGGRHRSDARGHICHRRGNGFGVSRQRRRACVYLLVPTRFTKRRQSRRPARFPRQAPGTSILPTGAAAWNPRSRRRAWRIPSMPVATPSFCSPRRIGCWGCNDPARVPFERLRPVDERRHRALAKGTISALNALSVCVYCGVTP